MGFYTSLTYYRPRPAPIVTPRELRLFFLDLLETGVLAREGRANFEIKFGSAIDRDDRPSSWLEPINSVISTVKDIAWDWTHEADDIVSMVEALGDESRPIHRAFISLGPATDDLCKQLSRIGSPENDEDFVPDSWSMEFGPIMLEDPAAGVEYHIGWMGISFGGNGYIFPWTTAEVLDRIERSTELNKVAAVCQWYWPVPGKKPSFWTRRMRRRLGKLWPYGEVNKPWDWYCAFKESYKSILGKLLGPFGTSSCDCRSIMLPRGNNLSSPRISISRNNS
ncbi:MAG TPA: hypothetical protein VGN12_12470 [Pirellulales bacterium]|jgi:hypothetical protein